MLPLPLVRGSTPRHPPTISPNGTAPSRYAAGSIAASIAFRRRKTLFVAKDELDLFVRVERIGDVEEIPFWDADGDRQVFQVYDGSGRRRRAA